MSRSQDLCVQTTFKYEANNINPRPLRPRQAAALESVRAAMRDRHKRIILQAPTGMGKTLMAAHMITGMVNRGLRLLFVMPALGLMDQTIEAFRREGILDVGVIQANHPMTNPNAQVQIAMVQTLSRRPLPDIDFIIIDEAHEQFDWLNERLDSAWAGTTAIGLTATPWARGMGLRWTRLVIAATIPQLVADGHLTPMKVWEPSRRINRKALPVRQGEFKEHEAAAEMQKPAIVGDVVDTWRKRGSIGKTLMFCVNRAHARAQADAFANYGVRFGYIDANTPADERRVIIDQMLLGEIAGIASVGTMIRGIDTDVRCIIDAQPTKSLMRHVQKLGRGIRTADGKTHCVILDHAGNCYELGLPEDIVIKELDTHKPGERGETVDQRKQPMPRICQNCAAIVSSAATRCPNCAQEMPPRRDPLHSQAGELVPFGSDEDGAESRIDWYRSFRAIARDKEFSNPLGWAANQFRDKFGVWPPWKWRELTPLEPPLNAAVQWSWGQHLRRKIAKRVAKEQAA
jgi:superfamily II DNA or RNA helicase